MDKRDFASQSEKYKEELLRLYGKSNAQSQPVREPVVIPKAEVVENPEFPQPDEAVEGPEAKEKITPVQEIPAETEPEPEPLPMPEQQSLEERYPEPDLSDITGDAREDEVNSQRQVYSDESMGTASGYIVVNVRTGGDSSPVPGATVTVTAINDGNRLLLASGETNISGATDTFTVPVPDVKYSLKPGDAVRPYGLFDISVRADGFFNARGVDVPVFDGITSVQNFSMVPVPLYMKSTDETITYFNQEPNI